MGAFIALGFADQSYSPSPSGVYSCVLLVCLAAVVERRTGEEQAQQWRRSIIWVPSVVYAYCFIASILGNPGEETHWLGCGFGVLILGYYIRYPQDCGARVQGIGRAPLTPADPEVQS